MFGVLTLTSGLFFSSALPTNAQTVENQQTLAEVTKADPDKLVTEKLVSQDSQTLESKQGDLKLEIDLKDKEITIKQDSGEDIEISLPENLDLKNGQKIENSVVFDGTNVDLVVQAVGGGIRQILNIDNASKGNSFDFPVKLESNQKLTLNIDGSAMITQELLKEKQIERDELQKTAPEGLVIPNYKIITFIAKPWARDKNNKELPTYYSVNNDTLTQHIDYANAVFPVSADPAWCGAAVDKTYWQSDKRPGYPSYSLGVVPTWCGRYQAHPIYNWDSWQEVVSKTSSTCIKRSYTGLRCIEWNWDKQYGTSVYWSMYDQWVCHYSFLAASYLEKAYDLEVWRPNVGLPKTVLATCNPK